MDLNIYSPGWDADPYPLYSYLRDNHPVYFDSSTNSYVLTRFADVERGFKDKALSSESYAWQTEPVLGDRTILTMDGREHSSYRSLITPSFKSSALLEGFLPLVEAEVENLIDGFRNDGRVELVQQYSNRLPIGVIVAMLGLPMEEVSKFEAWNQGIMDYLSNVSGDQGVVARSMESKREMDSYLLPIIEERSQAPGGDLLSALCIAEIDGVRMTPSEIRAFVGLLMVAGGETTGRAITSLFANLLAHPDVMEELRKDRSLVDATIAETLRYSPPGHVILREAKEEIEFSGVMIPPKGVVMLMIGSANRDDRRFDHPDTFDIHRSDLNVHSAFAGAANHLGFGGGRHFCVGSMLAKFEIEASVNALLDAMPHLESDGPLPPATGIFSRAPALLPLKFGRS